jgi:tRNA A-37 threonylcarbamoyl transferase component Bud32
MPSTPDIPYPEARARRGAVFHAARSSAQADLYEYDWDGHPALLKDFNGRPGWVRRLWGGRVCAREARALNRLADLPGVPHLLATAGPYAFIMERIDAVRLPRRRHGRPSPRYWANARALLDRLHDAGVSHGDLRRKNLLIGPGDEAYLIDFATAARLRDDAGPEAALSRWFFHRIRRIDRVTFARIKASYDPSSLDVTERAWLAGQPWYLKAGRWLKRNVYVWRKDKVVSRRRRRTVRWVRARLKFPKRPDK